MKEPQLYTISATCALLSIGPTKLYALIKQGRIRSIKIDRNTRISHAEIERFVAEAAAA